MSVPSSLQNTVFAANQVSFGTIDSAANDPITYTETNLLSDQSFPFIGSAGATATATVTDVSTVGGVTTVTVRINSTNFFLNNQTITGTVLGNDTNDILLTGTIAGSTGYILVTADPSLQPGPNKTITVPAEANAPAYTACYCAGTRILTETGEVAVEALSAGDRVVTADGTVRPVRWVGRRSYAGRFLRDNPAMRPVRFRAGSLGEGLPRRDLLVSPEHRMFIDGLLVRARDLVNGVSVVHERGATRVDYVHVELDSHDVLLAEGVPSESFVDDGTRAVFHNAHEAEHAVPDTVTFCAPRVEDGPALDAIRRRVASLAGTVAAAA